MRKYLILCIACLMFTGCDYELPMVDAGSVGQPQGEKFVTRELTSVQVSEFAEWCTNHKEGWGTDLNDYYPLAIIQLRYRGKASTALTYTGSMLVSKFRSRRLSVEEGKELQRILGITNG